MKKYSMLSILLLLCACNSVTPVATAIDNSNDKMTQFDSCETVMTELDKTQSNLEIMRDQKRRANAANGIDAGMTVALAAIHPINAINGLFNYTRTGELDKSIQSHEERKKLLEQKKSELNCIDEEVQIHNENQSVLEE